MSPLQSVPRLFGGATTFGSGAGAAASAGIGAAATALIPQVLVAVGVHWLAGVIRGRDEEDEQTPEQALRKLQLESGPAAYLVGEPQWPGRRIFVARSGSAGWFVHALHEGEAEAITGIFVDNEFSGLAPESSEPGAPLIPVSPIKGRPPSQRILRVWPKLADTGAQPFPELQRATRDNVNPWTSNHQMRGVSGAAVQLIQVDGVWSDGVPSLSFLVKGAKIIWPGCPRDADGEPVPTWTANAAAVRWWWLTERRGVDPALIDLEAFRAAYELCEETLYYSLPPSLVAPKTGETWTPYQTVSKRYEIHGAIFSTDPKVRVEEAMNRAWAGGVNLVDGVFAFEPGRRREPSWLITPQDILEPPQAQLALSNQQRISGIRVSLTQSRDHEHRPAEMHPALDPSREGPIRNLGALRFVQDPLAAGRLSAIALRDLVRDRRFSIRIRPGDRMRHYRIRPGEAVRVLAPDIGLAGEVLVVESVETMLDWSLSLVLAPQIDWRDAFVAPPVKPGANIPPDDRGDDPDDQDETTLPLEEGI